MSPHRLSLVQRRRFALGLSLFCLLVALVELVQAPLTVRPRGAWSFLFGPLWESLGSAGLVGFWLVLAGLFASYGINLRLHLQRSRFAMG